MTEETRVVTISTLEIVRAAWPIVTFVMGLIWAQINVYFKLKSLAKEHDHFKNTQYEKDRQQILDAIRKLSDSQDVSEKALEAELKSLRTAIENKFDKFSEQMLQMNITLAELKARSYPKTPGQS